MIFLNYMFVSLKTLSILTKLQELNFVWIFASLASAPVHLYLCHGLNSDFITSNAALHFPQQSLGGNNCFYFPHLVKFCNAKFIGNKVLVLNR